MFLTEATTPADAQLPPRPTVIARL